MDDDTVLITSYFNLANGRRQDTADTFRVDPSLPSRTSPDGTAALYIVTEASTGGHMGPRARRLCADTIAWQYSTHSEDPPSARLKAALRTAHDDILREFDGHVSVGVSVMTVEEKTVYLAQAAPAQVYVLHEGSLHSISASVAGSSPFAHALGANSGPQISVFRDEVGPGDVLTLCSSWFNRVADPDDLKECFGAGDADDIAEALLDLGKQHDVRDATVVVIEAIREADLDTGTHGGNGGGLRAQLDDAVHALAGVGKMFLGELRPVPRKETVLAHAGATEVADQQDSAVDVVERPAASDEWTMEMPQVSPDTKPDDGRGTWNSDDTAVYSLDELQAAQERMTQVRRREQATEEVPVVSYDDFPDEPAPPTQGPPEMGADDEPLEYNYRPQAPLLDEMGSMEPEPEEAQSQEIPPRKHRRVMSPWAQRRRVREPEIKPETRAPAPEAPSELDEVNSRLQHEINMGEVIPPVQAFADTSTTEPSRIYATSKDIQAVNRRPRRFGGIARPAGDEDSGSHVIRPGMSGIDLRQPMARSAPPAAVWFAAAVICLLAVFGLYRVFSNRHHAAFVNPYPGKFAANIARAKAAPTVTQQDAYLARAAQDITLAKQNGTTPAKIAQYRLTLQNVTDTLHKVTRETAPVVLSNFSTAKGAQTTQIATGSSTIYVLDSGRKGVYSVTPNPSSSPTQIVQANETDTGLTIGTPSQLATSGDVALVLDDKNILVRSNAGTKTAITLPQQSTAQKIIAMANFGPDVYLLDVAGSQVWRYPDAVAGYNPSPSGFFPPNTPDIGQAVSFTLDDKFMYILKSDGNVLKFDTTAANQQRFAAQPRTPFNKPNWIFTDVGLKYVWVSDPGNKRIVQLDKNTGAYVRSYVSGSSMDLSQLKSIAVPPSGKVIYALAGNVLYEFPVQP